MTDTPSSSSLCDSEPIGAALLTIVRRPWDVFVIQWNWKAAFLSAAIRGVLFCAVAIPKGAGAWRGAWIEILLRIALGGCWGSAMQALRRARPVWLAGLLVALALPSCANVASYVSRRPLAKTFVGRLAPEKNLDLLVDTMAQLEESQPGAFHLVVAGDGALRSTPERECARRIPGAACFLGHVADRQRLVGVYANCDMFIHPNPREPFGIAPLEAMASGVALVAPHSGGVRHYADDSNSWPADPTTVAFAAAVREIRDNPAVRCARQCAARATAERFDWENVTARYFTLYDGLCALVRDGRRELAVAPACYSTAAGSNAR